MNCSQKNWKQDGIKVLVSYLLLHRSRPPPGHGFDMKNSDGLPAWPKIAMLHLLERLSVSPIWIRHFQMDLIALLFKKFKKALWQVQMSLHQRFCLHWEGQKKMHAALFMTWGLSFFESQCLFTFDFWKRTGPILKEVLHAFSFDPPSVNKTSDAVTFEPVKVLFWIFWRGGQSNPFENAWFR